MSDDQKLPEGALDPDQPWMGPGITEDDVKDWERDAHGVLGWYRYLRYVAWRFDVSLEVAANIMVARSAQLGYREVEGLGRAYNRMTEANRLLLVQREEHHKEWMARAAPTLEKQERVLDHAVKEIEEDEEGWKR